MRCTAFALVAVVLAAATPAVAQPAQAPSSAEGEQTFSIDAALAAMRRFHPLLRAAASGVRVAEGNAVTAGHWTNPVLDASYMQALRSSSYDPIGTPSVGVTQFLELSGTPAARRRSAEAEVRALRADGEDVRRELEWAVREAFVRMAVSYERRRVYEDVVADLERAAGIVRSRVSSGMAPRYDASRIQLALELAHADLGDAEAAILRARGDLDVAVGPGAADLRGVPRFDALDVPSAPALAEAIDAAWARRPDVVAARHRADAASTEVEVAKRSRFPGIGVRVGAGYGQARGQLDVGAGVVVPLPLLERGQGTVPAAEARAEAQRQMTSALATAVEQRVRAAHAEYVKRLESLARFRAQAGSVNEGMRGEAEAGYREAKLSVLELVDGYQSVRDARLRLVDLAEAAQLARVAFGRAVGAPAR